MTEIAIRNGDVDHYQAGAGSLALRGDQQQWSDPQKAALAQLGLANAPTGDLAVFLHVAQRTGLDPFSKQIYMIARGGKYTIQTGIDGFRVIASRHPEYAGQVGPQWCGEDGVWRDFWASKTPPVAARVGILRRDWAEPVWGVAMYAEFNGGNQMWREKGAHQLAKCAEALGHRKAFPHDLAGLYTDDEMSRANLGGQRSAPTRAAAVTADELTGAAPPAQAPVPAAPADDRMSQEKQQQLLAAIRSSDIDDRWGWASGVLGRDVTSYGQLSGADADQLMADLAQSGVEQ